MAIDDAVNGRKAMAMLAKEAFDLVLCDWGNAEMSGLELLTWCRQQPALKHLQFIMVTSRGDKENVIQAIQAGVSDFVGKPFTNEQLLTKVKKALTKIGKLDSLTAIAPARANPAFANDSLSALTAGKPEAVRLQRRHWHRLLPGQRPRRPRRRGHRPVGGKGNCAWPMACSRA